VKLMFSQILSERAFCSAVARSRLRSRFCKTGRNPKPTVKLQICRKALDTRIDRDKLGGGGSAMSAEPARQQIQKQPGSRDMATPKSATAMDRLIGQKIQIFRKAKGMSQTELGAFLGVTFQQVQKYESGANRVGSGRLVEIARALEVPILKFFGEKTKAANGTKTVTDHLTEPYAVEMLKAFAKIKNVDVRRKIMKLTVAIALKSER